MLPAVCDLLHRLVSARALDTPPTGSRAGAASFRFRVNRGWAAARILEGEKPADLSSKEFDHLVGA